MAPVALTASSARGAGAAQPSARAHQLHRRTPNIYGRVHAAVEGEAADTASRLIGPRKEVGPYVLVDHAVRLTAVWDAPCSQAELRRAAELLQQRALQRVALTHVPDLLADRPATQLSLVCVPGAAEELTAAILQWTPATQVATSAVDLAYLPEAEVEVQTAWGAIPIKLALAGSTVCKITPDWRACSSAAAATTAAAAKAAATAPAPAAGGVDASEVAAAAVAAAEAGLADGSLARGLAHMF